MKRDADGGGRKKSAGEVTKQVFRALREAGGEPVTAQVIVDQVIQDRGADPDDAALRKLLLGRVRACLGMHKAIGRIRHAGMVDGKQGGRSVRPPSSTPWIPTSRTGRLRRHGAWQAMAPSKSDLSHELLTDFGRVASMVNSQIRPVVYFERIPKRVILSDHFFRMYLFGAFDGAVAKWGLHVRQKLAPMIEVGFVGYLVSEFCQSKAEMMTLYGSIWETHNQDPTYAATVAGGSDTFAMFQDKDATRLAEHYGFFTTGTLAKDDVAGFLKYFDKQEKFPSLD